MFFVFARAPRPEVVVWPGRRMLACVDALAWPAAISALLLSYVPHTGVVGAVVAILPVLFALRRLHAALLHNQRYRFSIWIWGCRLPRCWRLVCCSDLRCNGPEHVDGLEVRRLARLTPSIQIG